LPADVPPAPRSPHAPTLAPTLADALADELAALDAAGLRRTLRPLTRVAGAAVRDADGRALVDFASNDYLGLAADPRPAAAAADALAEGGVGAGAARLISGDHPAHHALERALAALKRADDAVLFASGWAANVGAIPALAGRADAVYADALNHASLIDGCRLSRAAVRVFPHNDVDALEALLAADAGRFRRRWVVVEGCTRWTATCAAGPRGGRRARARRLPVPGRRARDGRAGPDGRGSAAHWGLDARRT
jgi:7-keto-8-aminopelargonate synthetase-like enzyme